MIMPAFHLPISSLANFLILVRERVLRIDPAEVTFESRSFYRGDGESQRRLEGIGRSFLHGYHTALRNHDQGELSEILKQIEPDKRGFAFEGAGMALALLDQLQPKSGNRWQKLLAGGGVEHLYVLHVGYGWAVARLPWLRWRLKHLLCQFDPLLRWLVVDGLGFHQGFFYWQKCWSLRQREQSRAGYFGRAFDQGLGRSLWFRGGATVGWISNAIAEFHPWRRADLWSGAGIACAFAGRPTSTELEQLASSASDCVSHFRQGVVFGAEARVRAGIDDEFTERTCRTVCGIAASAAAKIVSDVKAALDDAEDNDDLPRYEIWRARLREMIVEGQCHARSI
jgi:hypothetical protein